MPRREALLSAKSVALALIALLFAAVLLPKIAEGRTHILLVFDEDKDFPGLARLNQSLRAAFLSELNGNVEFYSESLNLSQFRDERHDSVLHDYYRRKYAGTRLDLIVAVMGPSLEFLLRHQKTLFPGIPIVFCGVDPSNLDGKTLTANITGVLVNRAFGPTLDIALQLQPETRSVFVVGGTSSFDRQLQGIARRDFEPFESRAAITYLTALPMEDLLLRLSHLPPHSVVIYLTLFADGEGRAFVPHDALKLITRAANAPVYVSVDQYLGQGAVGGHVYSIETHGHDTAEIGLRILRGESPANIPITEKSAYRDIFDWRQLQRWGLDEARLPPGSVIEFQQPTAWDRYRWYIVAALTIIAFQGTIIGDLLLHRARRRRAEANLRESQERMSLAASAANLGFWMWDAARDEIWVAPEGRRFFGWEKSERLSFTRFINTLHPDDREPTRKAIDRSLEHGDDYFAEYRVVSLDGVTRWVGARGATEFGDNGRPLRMRGIAIDITERKRGEEALRESEERFRVMANTVPVMIWLAGTDKLCTFFNKGWLDFTGRALEQELGNGWAEGIYREDIDRFLLAYGKAFDLLEEFTAEYRLRRSDGEYHWVVNKAAPRFGSDGIFLGYIGSCIDITERKRAEYEALLLQQELAHVSRISTMGELAASLAHELNQPLTAILSNAQAAQRFIATNSASLDEVKEILADIVKDDSRAGEVIRQMRSLVKKEALEFALFDLTGTIREVVVLARTDAILHNIHVLLDIAPGLPLVRGDRVQLQQVLLNLLLNAFDAMKECPVNKREITVRAELGSRRMVEITVADHGTGLPGDKLDKIFQPFYTTKPNGLGMGLSISSSIIEAHGGRLWAENNADCGATFFFTVPVANEAEEQNFASNRKKSPVSSDIRRLKTGN